MKLITIGDTHGKNQECWGEAVDRTLQGEFDKCVFLGDYVDAWPEEASNTEILESLSYIIKLKKFYPDKIITLLGNHCVQYALVSPNDIRNPYSCSGYRPEMHHDLYELFHKNIKLFQLAYQYKNYLWTHAGVHQGWWDYDYPYHKEDLSDIADQLNISFKRRERSIFQVGRLRGGYKDVGGPLWADKLLTSQKPLKGLHQIVGHSKVKIPQTFEIDNNTSITFCDCLDTEKSFYTIEI